MLYLMDLYFLTSNRNSSLGCHDKVFLRDFIGDSFGRGIYFGKMGLYCRWYACIVLHERLVCAVHQHVCEWLVCAAHQHICEWLVCAVYMSVNGWHMLFTNMSVNGWYVLFTNMSVNGWYVLFTKRCDLSIGEWLYRLA